MVNCHTTIRKKDHQLKTFQGSQLPKLRPVTPSKLFHSKFQLGKLVAAFIAKALVFQPNHVLVLCETSGAYRLVPCYEP